MRRLSGETFDTARGRIAHHVRSMRVQKGLSQEDLAAVAGLHRTYVGAIERAERNVAIDNVERLASALGVDAVALLSPI